MTNASERAERLALEPLRETAPPAGFFRNSVASVGALWEHRELLGLLVRREIKAKYKNSVLGLGWSLIRPVIQLGIFYVVMGIFLRMRGYVPHFPIFVFSGIAMWSLFQEIINSGTGSVLANAGIVKKTYVPREAFPLASVGSALVNFALQLCVLLVAVAATSGFVGGWNFLYFLVAIAVVVVWGTALALLLSAANVYFRDIQYLIEVALMVGFYSCPIIYTWSMVQPQLPWVVQEIYLANPMTLSIMAAQRFLWDSDGLLPLPYASYLEYRLAAILFVGIVVLILCHRVFSQLQRNFAQEM